jgi:hypothetical protein
LADKFDVIFGSLFAASSDLASQKLYLSKQRK